MGMNIVSFSGGKDSTAMLLMMLEKGMRIDRIINVDTTKEFPQMYKHIRKVQKMIEPLKIETVKIDFDYFFSEKEITRGINKGKLGYGWTGARGRWCSSLKVEAYSHIVTSKLYNPRKRGNAKFNSNDITEFIGIAADEIKRTKKVYVQKKNVRFPLVELGITEQQALKYCYSKGLDWDGLYKKMERVSCWCCPLSRISALKVLYNDFPELWAELEKMDKKSWRPFKNGKSVKNLNERFKKDKESL